MHPADFVSNLMSKLKQLICDGPVHITIGYFLMIPPLLSVWLFSIKVFFPNYIDTEFVFGTTFKYTNYSYTPYTSIYVCLMGLAGAYLIKNNH
jgi:hypothetical protein